MLTVEAWGNLKLHSEGNGTLRVSRRPSIVHIKHQEHVSVRNEESQGEDTISLSDSVVDCEVQVQVAVSGDGKDVCFSFRSGRG